MRAEVTADTPRIVGVSSDGLLIVFDDQMKWQIMTSSVLAAFVRDPAHVGHIADKTKHTVIETARWLAGVASGSIGTKPKFKKYWTNSAAACRRWVPRFTMLDT